ncbi:hydroxymethylbilane synthase [Pendulispora albinea]|uniref:Porphobilinogen deaminase n=1 Tax=Pendulispora albinea TaxID=2741071 RepID=A0ABZ2M0B8_9BACT
MRLVYATRKSLLALAQCRAVIARLRAIHPHVEWVEEQVVTSGDKIQDRPLADIGGKGLFVKEIEERLLDGRAQIAVHSIKDVPGVIPEGLAIVCVPAREDPRDALVAPRHASLAALPPGATVGTSSLRRLVALKNARPDLNVVPMRGNVDTRLRKVDAGEVDAIVLANAGLIRLGLGARVTELLAPEVSLPAVGQGALGIEAHEGDEATRALLAPLHDPVTGICVATERGVMIAVEGDCRTPIAAHAIRTAEGALHLRAFIANPDGTHCRTTERTIPWPSSESEAAGVGRDVGHHLLAQIS